MYTLTWSLCQHLCCGRVMRSYWTSERHTGRLESLDVRRSASALCQAWRHCLALSVWCALVYTYLPAGPWLGRVQVQARHVPPFGCHQTPPQRRSVRTDHGACHQAIPHAAHTLPPALPSHCALCALVCCTCVVCPNRYCLALSLLLAYAVVTAVWGAEGERTLGWANAGAVVVADLLSAAMLAAGLVASPAFISLVMCVAAALTALLGGSYHCLMAHGVVHLTGVRRAVRHPGC